MKFEFSDTIAGYVLCYDEASNIIRLRTSTGEVYFVKLTPNTFARMVRNLGEFYSDCTGQIKNMLVEDQYLFTYGIYYPQAEGYCFEAKVIDFLGSAPDVYRFEEPDWWIKQAKSIADFYIKSQFGEDKNIDYKNYRTNIQINGCKKGDFRQETDTISRLIYGFASAFMLTGDDLYLEAAEKGTEYLRNNLRIHDTDKNLVYWYHAIDVKDGEEVKILASEFSDDCWAIPMYEQIYALAGPTQTYRITGNQAILKDIGMTIDFFEKYYLDRDKEGFFSHVDPVTFNPKSESLGHNKSRKNWNSVGDHAPAYLINLYLATYDPRYKDFLELTADCIEKYFQDYDNSPFVQERFHEDWSHDKTWGWQQDNAVVGHNLKIAWNLMRINNIIPKSEYVEFAKNIADLMPGVGMDIQRAGWYDVMSRTIGQKEEHHSFTWHDRKAWWQQEQGILAYEILYGTLKNNNYLKYARESAAFYNAYFLDHDDGSVYFNVLNNGLPYLLGNERNKGSHSMSGYHSIELAYLATIYTNLLNTKKPVDLYFKPEVDGFPDGCLRVQPDILPPDTAYISEVWVDNKQWTDFEPEKFIVNLPKLNYRPKIRVRIVPR